jgi:hypothetical protein
MKKKFKYLKTFEGLSRDKQHYIDSLLDKVTNSGIDSLTKVERDNLDNIQNDTYEEKTENGEMINYIISKVKENDGGISMGELEAEASPVHKSIDQEIHLVEFLDEVTCDIVVYGGYKYETVINEYTVEYSELSDETLTDIYNTIENSYLFEK